jgi:NAD-dependent SIR2 family protein deacetylase
MDEPHDRNVYVLGAGFSADAGAPLIHNFLDRSLGFLLDPATGLDKVERSQFEAVFKFRQEVAQAREKVVLDLDDIEQLFGLIEISERLQRSNQLRTSMQYLIVKTLQLATRDTRRPSVRFGARPGAEILGRIADGHPAFRREDGFADIFSCDVYTFFASLVAGFVDSERDRGRRNDCIITFNYDLVLEHALQRVGAKAEYHLPESLCPPKESFQDAVRVTVLKLHGSANWAICTNCEGSVAVLDEKVTENPNALRERVCPDCKTASYHPLLIPPSWDKSEYREITSAIWRRAVAELEKATRIVVIGYSMPEVDAFFKFLMTLALSRNHNLFKFVVVDLAREMPLPTGDEEPTEPRLSLQKKYAELLDPLFYRRRFNMDLRGFSQFISSGGCGMLGRGDALIMSGLY